MSMNSRLQYDKSLADAVEALYPKDAALQRKAVSEVINRARGLNRESVLPFLPTLVHEWTPAVAAGKFVPQPSIITLLAAYASTPPGAGGCIVTLTIIAPGAGVETVGAATILESQNSGEIALSHTAPAGSWLFAVVTDANGASGVSIAATRRLT